MRLDSDVQLWLPSTPHNIATPTSPATMKESEAKAIIKQRALLVQSPKKSPKRKMSELGFLPHSVARRPRLWPLEDASHPLGGLVLRPADPSDSSAEQSASTSTGQSESDDGIITGTGDLVKALEEDEEEKARLAELQKYYAGRFISSRGNEYFCEIDEDYLTDRFNLTGLNTEVQYYQYALDLVTDVFDLDCDDEMRETIEKSARHLYGLVHARYIVTTRGLAKMLEKYKKADFGKCPRVMCKSHPLLPMGQSDNPNVKAVKLYCARCEDIYNPKSSRHSAIDGAYFGTSFHNIIFQVYPALIPTKSSERYVPRIYGFKVHAPATLIRWQHTERDDMRRRLRKLEIESGFKDDEGDVDAEESEDEEDDQEVEALENGEMEGGELNNQI